MSIFGRVVMCLRGQSVRAGKRYYPGDKRLQIWRGR